MEYPVGTAFILKEGTNTSSSSFRSFFGLISQTTIVESIGTK